MAQLCTNPTGCEDYRKAYQRGDNHCATCGGDVSKDKRLTVAADKALDHLTGYYNPTPSEFVARLREAVTILCSEVEAIHADDPTVPLIDTTEANLMLQIRGIETIQDLKEAIARGHG